MTEKSSPTVNSYSVHEDQLKWFDVPLVAGGKAAVLHGDPTKPGTVVLRFKFPPNRQTPPHRHPNAEYTTILSGKVYYGEGEKFDMSNPEIGKVGTFAVVPAGQAHFVWTLDEEAIVQLQFEGPSSTIFVDAGTIRNASNTIDDVGSWHEAEMPKYLGNVRCWVNSGKHLLAASFSGFDPQATSAGTSMLQ